MMDRRAGLSRAKEGDLTTGTTVGRYIIIKLIGAGGMGQVYAAYDPDLDRRIALKLLHQPRGEDGSEAHGGLLREAKALARLSHPNVVSIHDIGSIAGHVFIAMELIEGVTLREWMGDNRHPWREVVRVFVAAGHGLMAAHQAGLVHRDFKPENVLMTRAGQIRVSDFGLARPAEELSSAGKAAGGGAEIVETMSSRAGLVGTPAYMAPEQFADQPTDARTDQFSFCVALYEAVYGERPFAGTAVAALAENVQRGVIRSERHGTTPPALRRIILRGLEPSPARRYPSMELLLRDLERLASPNRLRIFIWSTVAAMVTATIVAGALVARQTPAACADGPARLQGIWDPSIKDRVPAVFPGQQGELRPRRVCHHQPVARPLCRALGGHVQGCL